MWIRRLLLASVTLAIIIAFYLLYATIFAPPPEAVEKLAPIKPTKPPRELTTQEIKKPGSFMRPEEVVMSSPGEKAYFERYSNNRLLYQFRADHWKPAGKPGTFDLTAPELRVFLKRGQIINVSAEQGWIETKKTGGTRLDPIKGYLKGRVHIFIDRGTDPHRSAPELRPEDIIHIWLDEVNFNLDLNRIESKSPITVESFEADMIGKGLSINWNEVTNQIEFLRIDRGDKLVLYSGADIVQVEVPGSENQAKPRKTGTQRGLFGVLPEISAETPAQLAEKLKRIRQQKQKAKQRAKQEARSKLAQATQRSVTTTTSAPTTTTSPTTKPRSSRSYVLTFTSDVNIYQYNKVKLTGTMKCKKLKVIFDLPRSSARSRRGQAESTKPAAQTQPSPRKKQTGKRLEIFWKGPLEMKPIHLPYSHKRRFHIIAFGQPIKINQIGQGKARCKKLTYFQEAKQLWLDGTTAEPVVITKKPNRKIVAVRLFYDRKANIAKGSGPGFMQQQSRAGKTTTQPMMQLNLPTISHASATNNKMQILWKKGFVLHFGRYEKIDAAGAKMKQYLKSAEFEGKVKMTRQNESMSGDFIHLTFRKPSASSKKTSEQIETLFAKDNVLLKSPEQSIACDVLDVKFADGNSGRIPRLAKAKGNVEVKEKKRTIKADNLVAIMEDQRVKVKSSTSGKSKKKFKTRIIVREVHATGNVIVRDPAQPVNIDCQKLDAKIDKTGTLRFCYLEGSANNWARAVLRDFSLAGSQITLNLKTEQIDIPAPGELQFVNREDIDGSRLRKPVPIAISWSGFMTLSGSKNNQGIFVGNAKVHSRRSTLYAEKLIVDFENLIPRSQPQKRKFVNRFWIFSRLLGGKTKETAPTLKLPVTRKRPVYIQALPVKAKMVIVQNIERDKDRLISRTTLRGTELTIDFKTKRLNVPGSGDLTIEDYHLPNETKSVRQTAGGMMLKNPFGADVRSGPSQTVFTWKTGLLYLLDRRIAIFDGAIRMIHVSGPQILAQQMGKKVSGGEGKLRRASLTCENLKVEFLRGAFGATGGINAGAAELKKVIATGSVHLQEAPRSVIANRLLYDRSENIIVVEGSQGNPAYLYDEQGNNVTTYSGPLIVWDRQTGEIRAPGASITTTIR